MRCLLLHANKFGSKINEKSTRPKKIIPEPAGNYARNMQNCLVVFFCVEKNDSIEMVEKLLAEILKACADMKLKNILISPFAHLSVHIADSVLAKELYMTLLNKFEGSDFKILTSQFGYHKTLSLDIFGHPGAFRYREF